MKSEQIPGEIQISDVSTAQDPEKLGLDYLDKHPDLAEWAKEKGLLLYAKATSHGPVITVIGASLVIGGAVGLGVLLNHEFRKRNKQKSPKTSE